MPVHPRQAHTVREQSGIFFFSPLFLFFWRVGDDVPVVCRDSAPGAFGGCWLAASGQRLAAQSLKLQPKVESGGSRWLRSRCPTDGAKFAMGLGRSNAATGTASGSAQLDVGQSLPVLVQGSGLATRFDVPRRKATTIVII